MNKRAEGVLKISKGVFKRALALWPAAVLIGSLGVAIDGGVQYTKLYNQLKDTYTQSPAYQAYVQSAKSKLKEEFDKGGMTWQEYDSRLREINTFEYGAGYLKTVDEEFAKQYKQVNNRAIEMIIGTSATFASLFCTIFQGFLMYQGYSRLWESGDDDLIEGYELINEDIKEKESLPVDEEEFEAIEDDYH